MRSLRLIIAIAATLALAACGDRNTQSFQGWIEADLIFVGPDENGRIEVLKIREGDTVSKAAPLFSLEAELQKADMQAADASAQNARLAFARAEQLMKTNAGTQKAFDDAQAALRGHDDAHRVVKRHRVPAEQGRGCHGGRFAEPGSAT